MSMKTDFTFEHTLTEAIEDKIDNVFKSGDARSSLYQLALMQRIEDNLSSTEMKAPNSLKKKYAERVEEASTFSAVIANQLWQDIIDAESNDCVLAMDDMVMESSFVKDALGEALSKVPDLKPVTLTSFFQVLSEALSETIKPCADFEYDTDTVPLKEFFQQWYQFPVDSWLYGKNLGAFDVVVVPFECLADFLFSKAFDEDRPDDVSNEWLRHIHLCADEDTIRQDVKDWIADDRDEAIEEIAEPFDYDWTKFAGTDVLVIQN